MSVQESGTSTLIFPLTEHEFFYLRDFGNGGTPSSIAEMRTVSPRAVKQTASSIKRKLASRTMAQAIWKASSIGIEIAEREPATDRPLLNSLPKSQDVLRRIAGGYHAIELDRLLKIGFSKRNNTIRGLYAVFGASTHPNLVARAIRVGFFDEVKPIFFAKPKARRRERDKLTTYQQQLLEQAALGKSYREISATLSSLRETPTSEDSVHRGIAQLRTKIARLSRLSVIGPYQTAIRAAELGLLPDTFFETHGLNPYLIADLPEASRAELENAYERVLEKGVRAGANDRTAKSVRVTYRGIGAENLVQAILMMHHLKKMEEPDPSTDRGKGYSGMTVLTMPTGQVFALRNIELDAIAKLGVKGIKEVLGTLPDSGLVTLADEEKGGKAVAVLAGILKGDTRSYSPRTDDLTYPQLANAYGIISSFLVTHPKIGTIENLVKLIQERLKQLNKGSETNS